ELGRRSAFFRSSSAGQRGPDAKRVRGGCLERLTYLLRQMTRVLVGAEADPFAQAAACAPFASSALLPFFFFVGVLALMGGERGRGRGWKSGSDDAGQA